MSAAVAVLRKNASEDDVVVMGHGQGKGFRHSLAKNYDTTCFLGLVGSHQATWCVNYSRSSNAMEAEGALLIRKRPV